MVVALALGFGGIVVIVVVVRALLHLFIAYADGPEGPPIILPDRIEVKDRQSEAQLREDWPPLHIVDREVRR